MMRRRTTAPSCQMPSTGSSSRKQPVGWSWAIPGLAIESLGGQAPVHGLGTYNGMPWWFYARHEWASLSVGGNVYGDDPLLYADERVDESGGHRGGWLSSRQVEPLILRL